MKVKIPVLLSVTTLALLAGPASGSAEIVFLSSGRTLSVKAHKVDGDLITLTLRSGGQVTCNKDLIEKIEAEEGPYPEPAPAPAQAPGQAGAGGSLLAD